MLILGADLTKYSLALCCRECFVTGTAWQGERSDEAHQYQHLQSNINNLTVRLTPKTRLKTQ